MCCQWDRTLTRKQCCAEWRAGWGAARAVTASPLPGSPRSPAVSGEHAGALGRRMDGIRLKTRGRSCVLRLGAPAHFTVDVRSPFESQSVWASQLVQQELAARA